MRKNGNNPAGFTLVELLVVIAIIVIPIALLLPVVLPVRRSNLKQRMWKADNQPARQW